MIGWLGTMERRVTPPRAACLIVGASVVVLGAALLSQYLGGLKPCVLCIYQRIPYAVTIGLAGLAFALGRHSRNGPRVVLTQCLLLACALALVAGAGIAAYHVGVEQKWWLGTDACAASSGLAAMNVEELRELLLRTPVARCDEVSWSMFGVSMAGYNFIVSLFLAAASLWLAWVLSGRDDLVNGPQPGIGAG